MDINAFLDLDRIAVVGASRNPDKYGYKVLMSLVKRGKTVYPVNPGTREIEGITVYPNLKGIDGPIDGVSIIVPPSKTEQVVEDIIALGIKHVWMQPGAESDAALSRCRDAGINVVHNQCVLLN